jgi:hypothetical protein
MEGFTLQHFDAGSSCSDSGVQLYGCRMLPSGLSENEHGLEDENSESEKEKEPVGSSSPTLSRALRSFLEDFEM